MNPNTYYTPLLSEFFEGFEYEVMIPEKETWSKEVFYLNESHIKLVKFVNIQDEFTKNKVRVQHLSREQIEAEGWEYESGGSYFFGKERGYWILERYVNNIFNIFNHETENSFRGTIKNINEFRKIIQMLNIKEYDRSTN